MPNHPARLRTKYITMGPRTEAIHIDAPGCIVSIGRHVDDNGRIVTTVSVEAQGDRFQGEDEWWIIPSAMLHNAPLKGTTVRVVRTKEGE